MRINGAIALGFCCLLFTGCAFHYYDPETATEHLWGFGHLRARVSPANEGVCVEATEVRTLGLGLDAGRQQYGLSLGYDRQGRLIVSSNAMVRLEWYTRDLFGVRAGTNFPPDFASSTNQPGKPE